MQTRLHDTNKRYATTPKKFETTQTGTPFDCIIFILLLDPCMGSGSLLPHARSYIHEDCRNGIQFYGQEISHTTYNLARMNMILHNVPFQYQHFRNGDTLGADWPTEEPTNYDGVCMTNSSSDEACNRSHQTPGCCCSWFQIRKAC